MRLDSRFMRRLTLVVLGLLLAGACGEDSEVTPSPSQDGSPPTFELLMSDAEFHAFGQLSGAPGAPLAETAAESLGVPQEEVDAQIQYLCQGFNWFDFPPSNWPALPEDVPDYEQFFAAVSSACPESASGGLDLSRAHVARVMSQNQLFRFDLVDPPEEAVTGFCETLAQSQSITAPLLAQALEGAHVIPEGSGPLAEIGVGLLIAYCPNLTDLLS